MVARAHDHEDRDSHAADYGQCAAAVFGSAEFCDGLVESAMWVVSAAVSRRVRGVERALGLGTGGGQAGQVDAGAAGIGTGQAHGHQRQGPPRVLGPLRAEGG
ncbi:hypothetical protein GCM10022295_90860 [Streptomyces osmaniensis]|uniref:Uncharacterized protein n=1 Tax=Streptomyces osmaniensis TaxID=593134 RepID=A0ABP6Z109_9ACTN